MKSTRGRNLNSVLLVTISVIVGACSASVAFLLLSTLGGNGNLADASTDLKPPDPTLSVQNGISDDGREHDALVTGSIVTTTNIHSLDELSEYESPFDRSIALRGMLSKG